MTPPVSELCFNRLMPNALACLSVICGGVAGRSDRPTLRVRLVDPWRAQDPTFSQFLGILYSYSAQPEQFGVLRVRECWDVLGRCVARVTVHRVHFPGDHVQIAILEHQHDEPRIAPPFPIFRDRNELGVANHLHRAVACERDRDTIRMYELAAIA